eukprot:223025-Chlamydomonas_euryale.AAC.4
MRICVAGTSLHTPRAPVGGHAQLEAATTKSLPTNGELPRAPIPGSRQRAPSRDTVERSAGGVRNMPAPPKIWRREARQKTGLVSTTRRHKNNLAGQEGQDKGERPRGRPMALLTG